MTTHPIIGSASQNGTLDSLDFCTSGFDIMLSSVLVTSSIWKEEKAQLRQSEISATNGRDSTSHQHLRE
jgi:hypothetical protein